MKYVSLNVKCKICGLQRPIFLERVVKPMMISGRGGEEFADELSAALDAAYDNNYVLPDLKK